MFFDESKNSRENKLEVLQSISFLDSLIENIPNMVFVKDAVNLKFVLFNKASEGVLGISRSELIGKNDYDFFPKAQADFFTSKDRDVLRGNRIVDIPEEVIQTRHMGQRILHTKKIPLLGPDGKPEYLLGISEDITDQKKAEQERLRLIEDRAALKERDSNARRSAFLAEASTVLTSSLDYDLTLVKLAKFCVTSIGDWCTITILDENGEPRRVAAVHRNPLKSILVEKLSEYAQGCQPDLNGEDSVARTGKSLFTPNVDEEDLIASSSNTEHAVLMRQLGYHSCMIVPITARGKNLGSIAFVSSTPERIFDTQDLAVAEEIGRRAGIAIDNAMLYQTVQKALQARDEFFSIASHELKTPLTSVKLQLQLLRRRVRSKDGVMPPPEKLLSMLDSSDRQISRLSQLVEDLLDVSRIHANKLAYTFESVDLTTLVHELLDQFFEGMDVAKDRVTFTGDENLLVFCDRFRMEQVATNLLSNALKYGNDKPIEVVVRRKGNQARLEVKDYGMGIPLDKQQLIFERFERVLSNANISGLGLGLFIVRSIVQAHEGQVWVESKVGEGSRFIVEIPLGG